jgi:hypothetical protein
LRTRRSGVPPMSRVATGCKFDPTASRLSICEEQGVAALISVGRAPDHTKARNFLKLPFIANANFALFRLVVNAELVAIRPKNDLLARRSFRRGL